MQGIISTHVKSASLGLAKGVVRAAAVASTVVTLGVGSIGPSGLGLLGVSGLAIAVATPAQARCLIGGAYRYDIADRYCLEAQRTGCVRSMLTPSQYTSCLKANKDALDQGRGCIDQAGRVRNDLSAEDCEEGLATGCVQRLLTAAQYRACMDAQPPRRR